MCVFCTLGIIDLCRSEQRLLSCRATARKFSNDTFRTRTENRQFTSPLGIVCNHNFFVCCGMLTYKNGIYFTLPLLRPPLSFPSLPFWTWRVMRFPLLCRRRDDALSHFQGSSPSSALCQLEHQMVSAGRSELRLRRLQQRLRCLPPRSAREFPSRKLRGMGGTVIWSNQPSCFIF